MRKISLIFLVALLGFVLASCSAQVMEGNKEGHGRQMAHSDTRLDDAKEFSQEISKGEVSLQKATGSQILSPQDGDTLALSADIVKKEIGGKEVRMFAYNGQIPGPLLKVKKGSSLLVEFKNNLDMPTTIHWHGIRVENKFDGVPSMTQQEVNAGEQFTYNLTFPDEGMFWYHPHLREDYQQELGLYGNILVSDGDKEEAVLANREEAIFLDDISMDSDGIMQFFPNAITNALMGRFGNLMLANGDSDYSISAKKGEVVRFYLTNSANTRTFNIAFEGGKIKLVGADQGNYEKEQFADSIIISPSERVIADVYFDKEGSYRLTHTTPSKVYKMASITVEGTIGEDQSLAREFNILKENKEVIDEFATLRSYIANDPNETLRLGFSAGGAGMHREASGDEGIEWEDPSPQMNAMMTNASAVWFFEDEKTGKRNMDIDYRWKVGDLVKIRLFNDPNTMHPMQHPIHFHGQRFVILSTNGKPNENMVWKDTVLVPSGSTIDILLEISNPGTWMAQCHIAEHLQAGMMTGFTVT